VSAPATTDTSAERAWLTTAEKGSVLGIRFLVFLATIFGRGVAGAFMWLVTFYYVAFSARVRRVLRDYYRHLDGSRPSFVKLWKHVHTFARVALDRFFFAKGRDDKFVITRTGHEHLEHVARGPRGAILMTAHLGSQAAMSAGGHDAQLRINIVGYFKNARMINEVLAKLDPASSARVIHIEPGSATSVLRIKEKVDAGELIALAGDRLGLNDRAVEVEFLGARARFPTGPFVLAAMLRCPVYLVFALFRGGNRYDLFCEPLVDVVTAPRDRRDAALTDIVQRYAQRLEVYCRMAPDNWFNFYDLWSPAASTEGSK